MVASAVAGVVSIPLRTIVGPNAWTPAAWKRPQEAFSVEVNGVQIGVGDVSCAST